jgi:hypothetical protein
MGFASDDIGSGLTAAQVPDVMVLAREEDLLWMST